MSFSKHEEKRFIELQQDVLRFCRSLTRGKDDAEDLCQTTYMKAWAKRDKYESGTNLRSWLLNIAHNQFFDNLRKEGKFHPKGPGSTPVHADMEDIASTPSQQNHLELTETFAAFNNLPPDTTKALFMIAVEGYSYEETAAEMGLAIGTVKSKVNRSRHSLAAHDPYNPVTLQDDWADQLVRKLLGPQQP